MPKSKNKSHHRGKKLNIRARNVWSPFVEQKKKATIFANGDYPICSRKVLMDTIPLFRLLIDQFVLYCRSRQGF